MRGIVLGWICVAGCGGTPLPAAPPILRPAPWHLLPEPDRVPVDPIVALTPDATGELSWVVPGPIQFELGGAAIPSAGSGRPIEVGAIEQAGNLERIAVRLEHARFSVWTDRVHLLSVLKRDQRIEALGASPIGGDIEVVLHAGATVRRLAHRDGSTQVRYVGALQVQGWVPDDALGDRGRVRDGVGRIPTGRRTLMVIPGAVIRTEPRWAAGELAIMANAYFLDTVNEVDEAWTEVSYEDGDVAVHGFVSRRDPPGLVHHWHEIDTTPTITPNATVASGTCLYARANGDAIGYIVGNLPVELDDGGVGWSTLGIDTPWGPLSFVARGATAAELATCAPPSTVPPATPIATQPLTP